MADTMASWGQEILSVALLYPLLWWNLKQNQRNIDRMLTENKEGFEKSIAETRNGFHKFINIFQKHSLEDDENFKAIQREISKAVWKTKLTNEQILEVAKARVWLTSEKKLDFIRKRLEKNNLRERKEIIKKQIATELWRRSEEYTVFLNQFTSPVWLVGDWINNNFPMEDFLNELYDIIFRDCDENKIHLKVEDCRFVMSAYQNELWQKMKLEINQ